MFAGQQLSVGLVVEAEAAGVLVYGEVLEGGHLEGAGQDPLLLLTQLPHLPHTVTVSEAVLRIRIRIHMCLGLPDPDLLVRIRFLLYQAKIVRKTLIHTAL